MYIHGLCLHCHLYRMLVICMCTYRCMYMHIFAMHTPMYMCIYMVYIVHVHAYMHVYICSYSLHETQNGYFQLPPHTQQFLLLIFLFSYKHAHLCMCILQLTVLVHAHVHTCMHVGYKMLIPTTSFTSVPAYPSYLCKYHSYMYLVWYTHLFLPYNNFVIDLSDETIRRMCQPINSAHTRAYSSCSSLHVYMYTYMYMCSQQAHSCYITMCIYIYTSK